MRARFSCLRKVRLPVLPALVAVAAVGGGGFRSPAMAGAAPAEPDAKEVQEVVAAPAAGWEFGFETGALWRVGDRATPLNYVLLPQVLTLKTPRQFGGQVFGGDWMVRGRFALEAAPVVVGPERYFVGALLSPSVEWWAPSRRLTVFLGAGGGVGLMDARGDEVAGAQGQDFNFTWFAQAGVQWRITPAFAVGLAAQYQHISNGGMNAINPGLDALGPMLGFGWRW